MISQKKMPHSAQTDLDILKSFFTAIDTGSLFESDDPGYFQKLREEFRAAFFRLLLHERPFLERTTGLDWPYEGLKRGEPLIARLAGKSEAPFVRQQARLFLILLPFPGQWSRLLSVPPDFKAQPEITHFLYEERQKIVAKLRKKRQKKFKLRHFCQILKRPRLPDEKGVLRIFSLPYLFTDRTLLRALSRRYFLYVEPPWGVLARHAWLRGFSGLEDPCLFGVGGHEDADFLHTQPGILTTRLAHGDFLEEDVEETAAGEKLFDIVFNATFDDMPRKRHRFMLELLQKPQLQNLTALFIGRGGEKNVVAFKDLVKASGLEKRVTVLDNLLRREVPQHLARCRIGVQVSEHENACRSIYECFRSDIPCVVSSAMAGFNFEVFAKETGLAVPDADLPDAIAQAVRHPEYFSPRKWFLKNSGSTNSGQLLNNQIRAIFQNQGYRWREDIASLGSSGASRYVDESHYRQFYDEFEILFECFQKSGRLPIRLSPR